MHALVKNQHGASAATAEVAGEYRYAAFISYRHAPADRKWAVWLHRALEAYRVPKRLRRDEGVPPRVGRCFRDEEELAASADLSAEIEEALQQSKYLIVVCSPRTPDSAWVNREVQRFREMGLGDRILALLTEGEPADAFPPALVSIRRSLAPAAGGAAAGAIDRIEPLAADVRPEAGHAGGHARRLALLRLAATVLGVRFDDLRQREQERRARRWFAVGAVLAAVAVVMTGLAAVAWVQWQSAEEHRRMAEVSRSEADRQRLSALSTIRRIVFDIQRDLRDVPGALDTRRKVLVMASEALNDGDLFGGDHRLAADPTHAVVFSEMADAFQALGRYDDAERAYGRSVEMLRQSAAATADAQTKRRLMVTLTRLAWLRLQCRGDGEAAAAALAEARCCRDELAAAGADGPTDKDKWFLLVASADVKLERGDPGALDDLRAALPLAEDGTADRSATLRRLGTALLRLPPPPPQAATAEATVVLRRSVEIDRARSADPGGGSADLAASLCRLAESLLRDGDLPAAVAAAAEAVRLAESRAAADPLNADAQFAVAAANFVGGEVDERRADRAAAAARFHRASQVLNGVGTHKPLPPKQQQTLRAAEAKAKSLGGSG